jgi:hypothetical protein
MKIQLIRALALAAATLSSYAFISAPALANEARLEARGGVIWADGESEAIAGLAAGYDFDLGRSGFVGAEVSADKVLTDDTRISFGIGGRAGMKIGENGKLYAVSTYQTKPCRLCEESVSVGAGYQHAFGKVYGKVEYRHFFVGDNLPDYDAALAGVGVRF